MSEINIKKNYTKSTDVTDEVNKLEDLEQQLKEAREVIKDAIDNIGVPQPEYPLCITYAYNRLEQWLKKYGGER